MSARALCAGLSVLAPVVRRACDKRIPARGAEVHPDPALVPGARRSPGCCRRRLREVTSTAGQWKPFRVSNRALLGDDVLRQLATTLGVERQAHSYWQFYLATSLARSNLLYALARRTDQAFPLYGALFAAQTEWLALEAAVARYCPHLYDRRVPAKDPEQHLVQLQGRFEAALQFVQLQRGNGAAAQLTHGFAAAALLADRCRWDLGEQLTWLSNIERYTGPCSRDQSAHRYRVPWHRP